jgi:hypothetical protein
MIRVRVPKKRIRAGANTANQGTDSGVAPSTVLHGYSGCSTGTQRVLNGYSARAQRVLNRSRRILHVLDSRPSGKLFIDVGANVGTFTRSVLDLWSPTSVRVQLAAAGAQGCQAARRMLSAECRAASCCMLPLRVAWCVVHVACATSYANADGYAA